MGGLLEVEGEAGGLGTQVATGPECGGSGRDDATRALRGSCCDACGPSRGVDGSPVGRGGADAGTSEEALATGVILGLRRAWTRARGEGAGLHLDQGSQTSGEQSVRGRGPAGLSPCPLHPALPDAQGKLGDLPSLLSPSPFTSAPPFQPSTAGSSSAKPCTCEVLLTYASCSQRSLIIRKNNF